MRPDRKLSQFRLYNDKCTFQKRTQKNTKSKNETLRQVQVQFFDKHNINIRYVWNDECFKYITNHISKQRQVCKF
jgi:hypothetical protein